MRIIYSLESINDLERLREFIEVKNPIAAQRIANELLTGIKKPKVFPKIGLPVWRAPDPEIIRDLFMGEWHLVKTVVPAQAGTQLDKRHYNYWIPAKSMRE